MIKKLIFSLSLGLSVAAQAIQITPPSNVLTEKSRYLSVKASIDKRTPIVVEVKKVVGHRENGVEILEATDEATVFPKQFMLNPESPQFLTVKYNGSYEEGEEKHYRIVAKTINLNDGTFKTGIKIQRSFHANLFVAPTNPTYKVEIRDIVINESTLSYSVANTGNFNTLVKQGEIILTDRATGKELRLIGNTLPVKDLEYKRFYPRKVHEIKSDLSEIEGYNPEAAYDVTITGIESRCIEAKGRCKKFKYSSK